MNAHPGQSGRYELQNMLGQGSMTEVWKAIDPRTGRSVAIKFLHANLQSDPDFVARFQREMPAIAALHHPNIVQYSDFSIVQPVEGSVVTAYAVMDYIESYTLADYIQNTSRQGKFLPTGDVVRLFSTISNAVAFAHQRGVIHGQIKPGNVLLATQNVSHNAMGEPMLTDFGMLNLLGAAGNSVGTMSGWRMDMLLYASPEQIMGSPANERSDVYALGVMLYELCTGTPPFVGNNGANAAAIMMQHTTTIATLPALINPSISSALTTIIMRCMAKDPWARFPTVAALVEALAQVKGQEVKEADSSTSTNMATTEYPANAQDMPTVLTHSSPGSAGMTPAGLMPPASGATSSQPSQPGLFSGGAAYATPSSPGAVGPIQARPTMPVGGLATPVVAATPAEHSGQGVPNWQAHAAPPLTPVPPSEGKRRTRPLLWIALAALLVLLVVSSSLGAYFAFFAKGGTPTPPSGNATTPVIVGHAYFVSSGLLSSNPESNQGITDQVQIRLANIPPPQAGKAYYAWLLNDITLEVKAIPLGQLTLNNGIATLDFPGDASHTNLLRTNSRLLITEEDSASPPVSPSLDPTTYLYYAAFSQRKPNPTTFSVYDHIRHLLASDPKVSAAGLTGGLDIWLYRNSQKILEWAGSARDAWKDGNADFIRRQLTRIIDYLDGITYAQKYLPGQKILADPTIAKIGLLTFDAATQNPLGYLDHIDKHLSELIALPDTSAEQKALAIQISREINAVAGLYATMQTDILQLYQMTTAQLLGSAGNSLLDTVATDANNAFVGHINSQAQVVAGVIQIHYDIQRMATFDVRTCTTKNPCSI